MHLPGHVLSASRHSLCHLFITPYCSTTCPEVFSPMLDLTLTSYMFALDSQLGVCRLIVCAEQAQCCPCRCFTADISRTFPVSGKFTAAQRDLYSAVLQVQVHLQTCVPAVQHFKMPRPFDLLNERQKSGLFTLNACSSGKHKGRLYAALPSLHQ